MKLNLFVQIINHILRLCLDLRVWGLKLPCDYYTFTNMVRNPIGFTWALLSLFYAVYFQIVGWNPHCNGCIIWSFCADVTISICDSVNKKYLLSMWCNKLLDM